MTESQKQDKIYKTTDQMFPEGSYTQFNSADLFYQMNCQMNNYQIFLSSPLDYFLERGIIVSVELEY